MTNTIKRKFTIYRMVSCALMAAVICVLSPIAIYIGAVPISLGLFAVLLTAALLSPLEATVATLIYLLLGAVGLPVFAGGLGGFSRIAGPTGGYLWSYLLTAFVTSLLIFFIRKLNLNFKGSIVVTFILSFLSCVLGVCVCYFCGTLHYCLYAGVTPLEALSVCVFPFIAVDLLKCAVAVLLGGILRKSLGRFLSK